jgi:hypothetical protein
LASALALWLFKFNPEHVSVFYGCVFPITLILSWPPIYKRLPRLNRDILRAMLGALIPATVYVALFGSMILAVAGTGCMAIFWQAASRKRQQYKFSICEGCSELPLQSACSGYQQQLVSIRRFQDEAMLVRMRYGGPPQIQSRSRQG